jgi:hypothetical protein
MKASNKSIEIDPSWLSFIGKALRKAGLPE